MGRRFGRRMFLCGTGGLVVGIPTLSSLLPRSIEAQPAAAPKRFFAFFSRNGRPDRDWYPTSTPAGYALRDAVYPSTEKADGTTHLHLPLPEDDRYSYAPLSAFATGGLSNILGPSLDPFRDKLTLLRGLDFPNYCGHNNGAFYGNYAACTNATTRALTEMPTIDQVLAYSDRFYPTRAVRRALHVGTGAPRSFSHSDYGIAGGAVEQQNCWLDPRQVWDAMFHAFTVDAGATEPADDPNRSLINGIYEDYARVASHRRLSGNDRQTLERHMSFLADIEVELGSFSSVMCVPPEAPPSFEHGAPWSETHGVENFRQSCSLLLDMCAAAIRCDLTRVATFDVGEALHDGTGVWEGSYHSSATDPSDWHHYAHDAYATDGSMRALVGINQWIADELFAGLLTRLDVPEGDGSTFLDNSLVCWGSELGPEHWNVAVPTLLAGSAGGAIRTGRYIDYCKWDGTYARATNYGTLVPGIPHNRLLVSMMQAMGLSPADYERDGLPGYGLRENTMGLRSWPDDAWDLSRVGEPLPGLMV